ncbi:MAG TPA: hypothetical protein VGD99_26205, partial [Anaerolineae bacterium]
MGQADFFPGPLMGTGESSQNIGRFRLVEQEQAGLAPAARGRVDPITVKEALHPIYFAILARPLPRSSRSG